MSASSPKVRNLQPRRRAADSCLCERAPDAPRTLSGTRICKAMRNTKRPSAAKAMQKYFRNEVFIFRMNSLFSYMQLSPCWTTAEKSLIRGRGVLMRLSVAVAAACLSMTGLSMADQAQAAIRKSTGIAAQGLAPALELFAKERDVQVIYRSELVGNRQTAGASGDLTVEEALTKLLSGTGLTFQYLEDTGVTIVAIPAGGPQSSSSSSLSMSGQRVGDSGKSEVPQSFWQRLRLAQADTSRSPGSLASSARSADIVEEVVVTAQRREQSLQDVPISITVLSGVTLDATNQTLIEELGRVPGLATVSAPLGGTFISLRGVGATSTTFAGTSAVGYYLDAVPFGFIRHALAPDASAFDLERVEVLRGPQGTLYGVNSQNGVIRVLTKDANLNDLEIKYRTAISTTDDGGENYRGDAAINLPLIEDKLAARFVVGYENFAGWIDRPNHQDANDLERLVLRGKLNAQLSERLSMGLSLWHSELDSQARSIGFGNRTTNVVADEPISEDYDIYAFRAGYDFGGFSATSMTSYMDYRSLSISDFSNGPATNLATSIFESAILAQEVNLASTHDGPWQWTAGAIYRDVDDRFTQLSPLYANPRGNRYNDYSQSYAAFAEITRRSMNDTIEITGGLRYFDDETRNRQLSVLGNPNAVLINSDAHSSKVSPRVVLRWIPSKDFNAYASYSEGFRGGFPQSPTVKSLAPNFPAVKPDNLLNYEIGSKGTFANGLVTYDAAVFFIDRKGIQQSIQVDTLNGMGAPIRVAALINGKSASGWGADLGLTFLPSSRTSFGANLSWNDLSLDADIVPANGVPLFFQGDRPTNSPEYTYGAWANQTFPVGTFEGYVSGSLSYISKRQSRTLLAGVSTVIESDSTFTSRASAGIRAPNGWGLSLFVDNLNNYNGSPIPEAFPGPSGSNRIRPRTIGLQFDHRM